MWNKICDLFKKDEVVDLVIVDKFGEKYNMTFPNRERAIGYAMALQDEGKIRSYKVNDFKW